MENIPTKEELDAKTEETHALWAKANEARCIAAACEEDLKDMRYLYYSQGVSLEERVATLGK